jgi:hypothetical protein
MMAGMSSLLCLRLGLVVTLLGFAADAGADADPAENPARRALVTKARKAHEAGQHAEALALGQQALAARTTPQLLFFVAQEQRETFAFADAFITAGQCASAARREPGGRSADVEREAELAFTRTFPTSARASSRIGSTAGRRVSRRSWKPARPSLSPITEATT